MAKKEDYRYTEDGVLLVRKQEQGQAGAFGLLPEYRELWFQCSEKNPDQQYLQMVLGGWFGLHKFLEGSLLQGLGYLLTCGCFGVFYLSDLLSMVCGNYCVKKVSYVDKDGEVERRIQKIYYGQLQYKKRAAFLFLLAVAMLVLAAWFVYQPIGNRLIGWLAAAVSGQVTDGTAEQLQRLIG